MEDTIVLIGKMQVCNGLQLQPFLIKLSLFTDTALAL